jgi:predicted nuclease of predicted toxin-antitoxin system
MNIKLDENLPLRLAGLLVTLGHDTDTVSSEGLSGAVDPVVWKAAQDSSRFFVTQDLDFSDVRAFKPGTHHGLLLVRLRVPSRQALTRKIETIFKTEDVENWHQCFVVATDRKIRIRRP